MVGERSVLASLDIGVVEINERNGSSMRIADRFRRLRVHRILDGAKRVCGCGEGRCDQQDRHEQGYSVGQCEPWAFHRSPNLSRMLLVPDLEVRRCETE